MIFASTIIFIFLVFGTTATKTLKGDAGYHIKPKSFGYDPEVGQVMFIGLSGEKGVEMKGLRGLQTDYYLKQTSCGTMLAAYQALGFKYYSDYLLGK